MQNFATPAARPLATAWEKLVEALGVPDATPETLAAEAARRVERRLPPGRIDERGRVVQYGSTLEASVDYRRDFLETELCLAESRHAAAVDDLRGAFGSQAAVDAAAAVLDELRRRVRIARDLAPLAQKLELDGKLAEARRELARVPRDPARPRVEPGAIPAGATSPEGFEVARKFELRAAARANALAEPTKWSSALSAVTSLEGKLDAWRAAHPKLAALLAVE